MQSSRCTLPAATNRLAHSLYATVAGLEVSPPRHGDRDRVLVDIEPETDDRATHGLAGGSGNSRGANPREGRRPGQSYLLDGGASWFASTRVMRATSSERCFMSSAPQRSIGVAVVNHPTSIFEQRTDRTLSKSLASWKSIRSATNPAPLRVFDMPSTCLRVVSTARQRREVCFRVLTCFVLFRFLN